MNDASTGGIYIHIPYCARRCAYCDFHSSASLRQRTTMLDCLLREMELKADLAPLRCTTLYFGGGTPTVYPAHDLKRLADKALSLFFERQPTEWTVEANPDDLTPEYLAALADIGVNRLSIGIQSFIDRDLQLMRRRHTAAEATAAVQRAADAGFRNLSIDLIYGIPGMSDDDWLYNLDCATRLHPAHISAYHLSIEPATLFGKMQQRGALSPVDDEQSAAQYRALEQRLHDAGYRHYEISAFALPGFASRHNSAYWTLTPYVGIGPSAHSYDGHSRRCFNLADNARYIEAILNGDIPETVELLTDTDRYNDRILTALRTADGIDSATLPDAFRQRFIQKAARHLQSGMLTRNGTRYAIPTPRFLTSDLVIRDLIEI